MRMRDMRVKIQMPTNPPKPNQEYTDRYDKFNGKEGHIVDYRSMSYGWIFLIRIGNQLASFLESEFVINAEDVEQWEEQEKKTRDYLSSH